MLKTRLDGLEAQFLERLEAHLQGQLLEIPEDIDYAVLPHLTGEAAIWYGRNEASFLSFEEFKRRFKAKFLGPGRYQKLWNATEAQQDPEEPVAVFVHRMRSLCLQYRPNWPEADLVDHIIARMTRTKPAVPSKDSKDTQSPQAPKCWFCSGNHLDDDCPRRTRKSDLQHPQPDPEPRETARNRPPQTGMVCTTVEAVRIQDISTQMHGQAVLDLFHAAISEDPANPERTSGPSIATPTVDSRPTPDAPLLGPTKPRIHTTAKPKPDKRQTATDMAQEPSYVGEGRRPPLQRKEPHAPPLGPTERIKLHVDCTTLLELYLEYYTYTEHMR
ncbi:Retrotransposon gag protein [Popillia japonica]|uniref:Retrotransposon gag protein n=1 Tax=Popillia japonica TaxID=7064 RepID=A0AAW1IUA0_POPJA